MRLYAGAAAMLVGAAAASASNAQEAFARDRNVGVRERSRPAYDALGVRSSSFLLFPKVEVSEAYEDNVFADVKGSEKSDWVTSLTPSLVAQSQWSRHALEARVQANTYHYSKFNDQSNTTFSADANGRLDVVRGTTITSGIGFDHLVEPRSSASSPTDAADPVEYNQTSIDLGATREVNRLKFNGVIHYRDYSFRNTKSFLGTTIDEKYRNNAAWEEQLRVDYALSPALAIYGTASHNDWAFKSPTNPTDVDRDASGNQAAIGADFDVTELVRGQVQVGYMKQTFDDPRVDDAKGLSLLGKVEYFPSQLLTVTANAERAVQATGLIGSPGLVHTSFGGQADYELRRNVILTGRLGHFSDDYKGLDRTDKIWTGGLGVNYLLNRRVGVNLLYTYYDQSSEGVLRGRDFVTNRVQLGVVLQY